MKKRKLGRSNLLVSELSLGSIHFGSKVNATIALEILNIAQEQGVNFIDTSEIYPAPFSKSNFGESEKIIGQWLKIQNRDSVVISSKAAGPGQFIEWIRGGKSKHNLRNLRLAVEGSLKRLDTDFIDIFYLNWPDRAINSADIFYEKTERQIDYSIQETSDALLRLIKEGKIRYFGVSNETPWGISQYLKYGGDYFACVQNPLNLLNRGFEISHAEMLAMENLSLVAYSPLAGGLLGKESNIKMEKTSKKNAFWLKQYKGVGNLSHLTKVKNIAKASNVEIHKLALQYVLSFDWVASAVVGCSTSEQCRQNFTNPSILHNDMLKKINKLHRERMPPCN